MTAQRFAPGDLVVRREVLLGEVWFAVPTICVEDTPELLALYLPPGAEFGFPEVGDWAAWTPDPSWPVPRLPAGWETVAC
ncbi:hypothetical protein [Micromonospora avicenniae]|uniref:Uncharacterized protein n=1 Tax=Micromonospora avicenniae TaxID=1198245 RepID=A0A1N6XDD4_9ACTN|nr:hypothetical protein [Micromonospora avicenniae]SIR00368.1 hypothetical protein SAMN05444858_105320 [Micromonospora avicenniae]